jgi:hypothetical protein
MVSLKQLALEYHDGGRGSPNKLYGNLPLNLGKLTSLEELSIAISTLSGPLPDMSGLSSLVDCEFVPSGMCRPFGWNAPEGRTCDFSVFLECSLSLDCPVLHECRPFGWIAPEGSTCYFSVLPECPLSQDCRVLHEWLLL